MEKEPIIPEKIVNTYNLPSEPQSPPILDEETSKELILKQETSLQPIPTQDEWSRMTAIAEVYVRSSFFKADIRDANQCLVKILAGRELGFGPNFSVQQIYIVSGKTALQAGLISAMIKRSRKYNYKVKELTAESCEIEFFEKSEDGWSLSGVSSFSIQDAKQAGLFKGVNWQKYPRNMLFARTISNGAKWFCPDVFGGSIYTPDELV